MIPNKLFNRNFLLLFQGQFVSQMGASVYTVGLIFWIKELTDSATVMGLLYMTVMIPMVLLGPLGGAIADRYSRKKIIVLTDILNGSLMIGVATVIMLAPQATQLIIALLFISTCCRGILQAFFQPAVNASIPDIVPLSKIEAANGLLQSSLQVSFFIGQSLGGLLFVALGAPLLMLLNGLGFLFSGISECYITIPQQKSTRTKDWRDTINAFKADTRDGFRYLRRTPGLLDLFLVMAVTSFFIAPFGVLLPFFVEGRLQSTPQWYGFLMAGLALGVLLGSALVSVFSVPPAIKSKLMVGALLFFCAGLGGFGYSNNVMTALLLVVLMGTCSGLMNVLINSAIQRTTSSELRGRVFGLLSTVTMALMPISMGLAGVVADLVDHNITVIYLGGGICALLATCLLLFSQGFHQLLNVDDSDVVKQPNTISP